MTSCAGCGAAVDELRAGHVAVFDGRFSYFCEVACRVRPREVRRVRTPRAAASPITGEASPVAPIAASPAASERVPPSGEAPIEAPIEPWSDADALLLATAGIAGGLTVALVLVGSTPVVTGARAAVALVGSLALAARAVTTPSEAGVLRSLIAVSGPSALSLVAVVARVRGDVFASEATSVAGVVIAVLAGLLALERRAFADADAERSWIARALALPGRRVTRDDVTLVASHELRPGEEIRVEQGEIVPVDLVVTRGEATVLPWLGASSTTSRREGDAIVAGARIVTGAVEGLATWTGGDRAWARLLFDPARRADTRTQLARVSRLVAEQGSLVAAALAGLAAFANHGRTVELLVTALAAHAALATPVVASIAGLHMLRGVLSAARRGIAYRGAEAFDAASRVTAAVFLARGTLLLGEPDVVEVEPTGPHDEATVLGWAAGAEAGRTGPVAVALARAARHRAVIVDAIRSPHVVAGLGVKAVSSTGEALLVGSRALMLEERVSIALFEGRVAELESLGRTVLLVAISGRLAGLVALQDGLRPGARAAVQHLLDVEVEPVLLSGDARETCETIARALDIEHIRPEVVPADRAGEVRRLIESGARVAVIGRPETAAAALSAGDVSVALGAAGASPSEWSVSLAEDDVRDAALAIAIAHRTQSEARTAVVLAVAPGIVGALAVAFQLLPAVFAPLAGLVGGAVSILHARATARRETRATPWDLVVPRE